MWIMHSMSQNVTLMVTGPIRQDYRGCGLKGTGFSQKQVVLNFNMPVGNWDPRANHKLLSARGYPQGESISVCVCDLLWGQHCADIQHEGSRIIPFVYRLF